MIPAVANMLMEQVECKQFQRLIIQIFMSHFGIWELTNIPILLNTSFNENVIDRKNLSHAIECFERTNMDILILENYFISRYNKDEI